MAGNGLVSKAEIKFSRGHYCCSKTKKGMRVFDILAGLNVEFNQVRIQILGKEKLPSLSETFAIVRGEENMRLVMLETTSMAAGSGMVTVKGNNKHNKQRSENKGELNKPSSRDDLWCTHCKKNATLEMLQVAWKRTSVEQDNKSEKSSKSENK